MSFLILDGMLGYPAKLYDASWIEWGQMASFAKGGALADTSVWRTDLAALSDPITYNVDNAWTVDTIVGANSVALRADMVNVTDAATCGSGTLGGGGQPIAPGY